MNVPAPLAYCDHVTRHFRVRGADVLALDDVTLQIDPGRLIAIAGPSGSGKSTLLAILGCLDQPTTGSVRLLEHELTLLDRRARRRLRRTTVATMLPQPAENLLVERSGVDNLRLAARQRGAGADGLDRRIDALVGTIGIGGFVERPAAHMSGGEQQRLALACALIGDTPLVLADEPTGALDDVSAEQVVATILQATAAGATIVAATHDETVIDAADAVIWLDHGRRVA